MKASRYNYKIKVNGQVWFVNGISEAMFPISDRFSEDVSTIINNPDDNKHFHSFIENLKLNGFILDDDVDEFNNIQKKYNNLRRPEVYTMMILPTYQCNLRCWYCIQEHQESWMSKTVIESILKRIDLILSNPKYKIFNISWFGGEPTLAYDVMKQITKYAKDGCKRHNKVFNCDITTNSTLLNSRRIEELHELGVTSYQISVDGKQETHDRIKVLKRKSAFEIALKNINEISKHTNCNLRFNYTSKTINEANELLSQMDKYISPDSRHRVKFTLCKVWQEKEDRINQSILEDTIEKGIKLGFKTNIPILGMCYADEYNFECIMPNGKVGKCDNDPASIMPGKIKETGDIEWTNDIYTYIPTFIDDSKHICHNCRYLPMCWSVCPQSRSAFIKEGGQIRCKFENKERDFSELLRKRIQITSLLKKYIITSANEKQEGHRK